MYIPREVEATVDSMLAQGKVVLVTGARQVGKTTVLKEHLGSSFDYVSLENPIDYTAARTDALLFFEGHDVPLIIDEVQRLPELFSTVKFLVDQSDRRGQIVLTGSQTYHLMKGVSESLAGRVRIIEMAGLSLRELIGAVGAGAYVPKRLKRTDVPAVPEDFDLWAHIHGGSMPEMQNDSQDWDAFYTDYVRTYLERDVRNLVNVRDEMKFYNFMVACAARSGQLFNASDVAGVAEVSHKTAQAWLSVLQASGVVRVLQPFWPNVDKRLTKTPKIYFMDTGLVCHLTRWTTPDALRNGAAAGHVFETFVVSEVLKSYMNAGANLRDVWFYRDQKKREVDLVIQKGHVLHPVEVKMGVQIDEDATGNFPCLENIPGHELGFGHVICQTREPYLVTRDVQAAPVWII